MSVTSDLRKVALTAHVTSSIGWFGAVAAFLALAIAGVTSRDAQIVRASYLAMEITAWFIIIPLAFVSLVSGIVSSLITNWGLIRHYWVLAKLLITIPATIVLVIHMRPIDLLAAAASRTAAFDGDLQNQRLMMVYAAAAALVVLLMATVLSIYKPRGVTPYGWRAHCKEQARRA